MQYQVKLDIFEGPLDLLLYLIKKNEVDIYDIPMALITGQYLEYLELMKELNLDIAGEFLVMASTLIKIKSQMLLPPVEGEGEGEDETDPRAELMEHLLEYQRYKEAAHQLVTRELLEKDIFKRPQTEDPGEAKVDGDMLIEASLFDLVDALRKVIERKDLPENIMGVALEKMTVRDKIVSILRQLKETPQLVFQSLFDPLVTRFEIVVTFLAVLELIRLRAIRVFQVQPYGEIRIVALAGQVPLDDLGS
jgi:segregation and condensation protein A